MNKLQCWKEKILFVLEHNLADYNININFKSKIIEGDMKF